MKTLLNARVAYLAGTKKAVLITGRFAACAIDPRAYQIVLKPLKPANDPNKGVPPHVA